MIRVPAQMNTPSSAMRLLSACATLAALVFSATPGSIAEAAPSSVPGPTGAYLFAHFVGESPQGEQIYFSVSEDGLRWTDLNDSMPVLVSTLGDKGVRDPSIIRSHDGKKFYVLATDLRIANGKGWDAARFRGSKSLVIWESTDLVNWSEPWMADVAGAIPDAGCAWAPEAIYDATAGDYFVYWATISPRDGVREARIYGARTKDFRTFTPPELYIERNGSGVNGGDIIDTQIIEVKGREYRYYRASRDTQITLEGGDSITGAWERIGDLAHLGYTARKVEGPILFQFNQEQKWALLVDQYGSNGGYLPLTSTHIDDPRGFQVVPPDAYSFGTSKKRHGGILNITRNELAALRAKWPSHPVVRLVPLSQTDTFLRHARFRIRADRDIPSADDARWRLASGLTGEAGTVSIRSVNFPDHHLVFGAGGLALAPDDGRPDYAVRATFQRVPGLAAPAGVSFRIPGDKNRYLVLHDGALIPGSAVEPRDATFLVRD